MTDTSAFSTIKHRCLAICEEDPLRPVSMEAVTFLSFVESVEQMLAAAGRSIDAAAGTAELASSPSPAGESIEAKLAAVEQQRDRYEAALRHLAETACMARDWRFARAVLDGRSIDEALKAAA